MKLILSLLLICLTANAEDFFLAQTAAGSGDGSSCGNAKAADVFYNNPANWGAGAGKISPGDTVHFCGTITDDLVTQGAGSSGSVITLIFETNARFSAPSWPVGFGALDFNHSFFLVNGGTDGIIECTANGTGLVNSNSTCGIYINNALHDIEVKNLTISNIFVHIAGNDGPNFGATGSIYANGVSSNLVVHNNTFDGSYLHVAASGNANGLPGFQCYSNIFRHYDHGISPLTGFTAAQIHHNDLGGTVNWDSPSNLYHHDGIHIFGGAGSLFDSFVIEDNYVHGDWGTNNTAMFFFEGDFTAANTNAMKAFVVRNNVMVNEGTHVLNNGFMNPYGTNWTVVNNTMKAISSGGLGLTVTGANQSVTNNVIVGAGVFLTVNTSGAGVDYNFYGNPSGPATWKFTGTNYTSFSTWRTVTGGEQHSQSVADLLVNTDGSLAAGSAALNGGYNLTPLFSTSFNGITRPISGQWDAGAYQSTSTPTLPVVITGRVRLRGGINLRVSQ